MQERDQRIRDAISPLTWWAKEPAVLAGAVANLVILCLDYFEAMGRFAMDNATMVFVLGVITTLSVIVRSQVSPVSKL